MNFQSYIIQLDKIAKYLVYYNEYRPHQGLNGQKPVEICRRYLKDENFNSLIIPKFALIVDEKARFVITENDKTTTIDVLVNPKLNLSSVREDDGERNIDFKPQNLIGLSDQEEFETCGFKIKCNIVKSPT